MGRNQVQRTSMAGRKPMRSPGRPPPARAEQRAFWRLVAVGRTSEEAALACGVSGPVGSRWFRHGGGMPPLSLDEPTGRYLSFAEREEIALLRAQDVGVRQIARRLGRSPSTISRELRRNAATRSGQCHARARWGPSGPGRKRRRAGRRPACGVLSGLIKDRPTSRVKDLPHGPVPLVVFVRKRRFACAELLCERRSFTEPTAQLPARARVTTRLKVKVCAAVTTTNRAVSEVAKDHGIAWWTVYRILVKAAADVLGQAAPTSMIGIDETRARRVRWVQEGIEQKLT